FESKKEKMRELLVGKLIFSVGDDIKNKWMPNVPSVISPPPLKYKITLDLNKEKPNNDRNVQTNYKVENNKIEFGLQF
ncbi:MAG: hypothetical protein LLF83_11700, partial [Methanobacterium sp.]|nr:hypothetical protein [Methanobacterium sp.]